MLCSISRKLYNHANWYIRQDLFNLENWLRYEDLNFILNHSSHYKLLKAQTSQQILKTLDKNWKSFCSQAALQEVDPGHRSVYEANFREFAARIDQLDADLKKTFLEKTGLQFM
ncbi:MAG: hypothetical protein ACFFC1_18765, partial [Promethearchaeota archaeon]